MKIKIALIIKKVILFIAILYIILGTFFFEYFSSYMPWMTYEQLEGMAFLLVLSYFKQTHDDILSINRCGEDIVHSDFENCLHFI